VLTSLPARPVLALAVLLPVRVLLVPLRVLLVLLLLASVPALLVALPLARWIAPQ